MEEKLKFIFSNINDNLKFAEAKNTGLIALNGAVLVAVLTIGKDILDKKDISNWQCLLIIYLLLIGTTSIIAIFISLLSTSALLGEIELDDTTDPKSENLLFFGFIATLDADMFIEKLSKKYNLIIKEDEKIYIKDLCKQIIVLSRITKRKFKFFNIALKFTSLGITTPIGWIILHFILNPNKIKSNSSEIRNYQQNSSDN